MVKLIGIPLPKMFIPRTLFGNWALISEKPILYTALNTKLIRQMTSVLKRKCTVHLPYENSLDIGITKKPKGSRMGGGKGKVVSRAALVKPGGVLVETESKLPPYAFKKLKRLFGFPTRICHILPGQEPTPESELEWKGPGPSPIRYTIPVSPRKWYREIVENYAGQKTLRVRNKIATLDTAERAKTEI